MKLKQQFIILFLTGIITTTINAKDLLPDAYTTSHSDSSGIKKNKKIKWFIQAGIQDANAKESYLDKLGDMLPNNQIDVPMKSYVGFKVGLNIDIPIYKRFSISSGLNYIRKGTDINYSSDGSYGYTDITHYRMNFIELPMNLTYNVHKDKGFMCGSGIVLSYGIGGKVIEVDNSYDSTGNNISSSKTYNSSIKFDGNSTYGNDYNIHFKPLELSGNLFLGYKFSSRYIIKAEYNQGFTNIFVNGGYYTNGSFKTSYFALNFCYGL